MANYIRRAMIRGNLCGEHGDQNSIRRREESGLYETAGKTPDFNPGMKGGYL